MMPLILLAEDDPSIRESLTKALRQDQFEVLAVSNGLDALRAFFDNPVDAIVADIKMPGMDGISLLGHVQASRPETIVILITAFGSIDSAVEAMKKGAYDYLTKPVSADRLTLLLRRALRARDLAQENEDLRKQIKERYSFRNIVGRSGRMLALIETLKQIAPTDATVLIRGESGTGKELIARALHYAGRRAAGPFVGVSCSAFSEGVLESELFGHEKGAFTGAYQRKKGRFELAHGGTLFLDEVGDLSLAAQAKLLRVLQEQEFERVGGTETIKVDIRLVAATNKDLEGMVEQGVFREDLYYRLKVVTITIPPFRDRAEDIPLLVSHFLSEFCEKYGKKVKGVEPAALHLLSLYPWPGNVRELRHVIEEMVLLAKGDLLSEKNLPPQLAGFDPSNYSFSVQVGTPLAEVEKRTILYTLKRVSGNKRRAAELLGIGVATLYRKLAEYGLDVS